MLRMMRVWTGALLLMACGPIMGDPCTVNTECGPGVCLNRDFTPGGACSLVCTLDGPACPAGSTCVARAIDSDTAGCLHACKQDSDCRTGYLCRVEHDSKTSVCVGSAGVP